MTEFTSSYVANISIFSLIAVVSSLEIQDVIPCSQKPLVQKPIQKVMTETLHSAFHDFHKSFQ